ncbi:MAG: 3-hydroxyacyl-ACP dehydratase FabZ [Acidobacteriaceae bacterium]
MNDDPRELNIDEILRRLPHRYPFLLVDRVLEYRLGESIRALKNVTYNEPFFRGHFPRRPVMPGVMIIEALAQAAAILCFLSANVIPNDETRFYFVGIDEARFRKPVDPAINSYSPRRSSALSSPSGASPPRRSSVKARLRTQKSLRMRRSRWHRRRAGVSEAGAAARPRR